MSIVFNEALVKAFPPEERSFFRVFKAADLDGSHRIWLGGAAHAQVVKEVGNLSESALARLRFLTRCDALLHGDALRRVQRASPHCTAAPELYQ